MAYIIVPLISSCPRKDRSCGLSVGQGNTRMWRLIVYGSIEAFLSLLSGQHNFIWSIKASSCSISRLHFLSDNTSSHIQASSDYIDQHTTIQIQLMLVNSRTNILQAKWSNSPLSSSSPSSLLLQPALPGLVA